MDKTIKRIWKEWGKTVGLGLIVLVIYLFLRLPNITILPVFADEAIYIRWSQVMRVEPTLRFLPLSDGKQPLFMWLMIPFLKLISDPLQAGRTLSVVTGLGSLLGIFLVTWELFKNRGIALTAAFFYAIIPYFVFFDRMALVDSMLMMFSLGTAYLSILLIRYLRLDLAMISGLVLGAALLTKSPAIFMGILFPTSLIVADWFSWQSRKKAVSKLIKVILLWLVVLGFGIGVYNLLRLGPNFHMIALRNKDYIFSFSEIMSHPLDPLRPHLGDLASWFPNLFTWPIFLLSTVGLFLLWQAEKKRREVLFLLLIMGVPLLTQSIVAKVFTPRYLLFTVWPGVIFAAVCMVRQMVYFRKKFGKKYPFQWLLIGGFVGIIVFMAARYNSYLLTAPEKASLPRRMRSGYTEEWTAGHGIEKAAEIIKNEAAKGNVLVGTEGYFGTLPDGLQIYLEGISNVTVIGVGYPIKEVDPRLVSSLINNEVYLIANQSRFGLQSDQEGLLLIAEYPKATSPDGTQDKLLLFKLNRDYWERQINFVIPGDV